MRNGRYTSTYEGWERHSKYLYDGDFFRLRSVTLGYDFPSEVVSKAGLSGVKLYVIGNNLLTWQKDKNLLFDPEASVNGETGLETPATKTVTVGLTVNF